MYKYCPCRAESITWSRKSQSSVLLEESSSRSCRFIKSPWWFPPSRWEHDIELAVPSAGRQMLPCCRTCVHSHSGRLLQSLQVVSGVFSVGVGIIFAVTHNVATSLCALFRVSYVSGILVSVIVKLMIALCKLKMQPTCGWSPDSPVSFTLRSSSVLDLFPTSCSWTRDWCQ